MVTNGSENDTDKIQENVIKALKHINDKQAYILRKKLVRHLLILRHLPISSLVNNRYLLLKHINEIRIISFKRNIKVWSFDG